MTVRTVERRGERRLVIDIRYEKPDGSKGRYRRDAQVQTKAGAIAEERRRLVALEITGVPCESTTKARRENAVTTAPSACPTFKATTSAYLANYAKSVLKPSTMHGYTKIINGFLLARIGDMTIDMIDSTKVRALDAELVERGVKPSTRRQMMIVLRSILCRYAVEAKLLPAAPSLPTLPKQGGKVPSVITSAEVEKILAAVSSRPGHRLAFLLAAHAGLRAGEIRGLRCMDVDLASGHLIVRESICHGEVSAPKSGHEREVPLTPRLRAAIEARVTVGGHEDRVSLTEAGTPWGEYGLIQAFKRACQQADIAKTWRFHDLRHYFVTRLFNAGIGAHVVQALAGHQHLSTTQRYAHVGRPNLRDAIAQLDT